MCCEEHGGDSALLWRIVAILFWLQEIAGLDDGVFEGEDFGGYTGGKGFKKPPMKFCEQDEYAFIVFGANQSSESLAQAESCEHVVVSGSAEMFAARFVENITSWERNFVENNNAERASGHINAVAHSITTEQATGFNGSENVHEGCSIHGINMLREEVDTFVLELRSDPSMSFLEFSDRGEKSETAAAGSEEKLAVCVCNGGFVFVVDIADGKDFGLLPVVEG